VKHSAGFRHGVFDVVIVVFVIVVIIVAVVVVVVVVVIVVLACVFPVQTHPCPIAVSYPLLSLVLVYLWVFEGKVSEEWVRQQLLASQSLSRIFVDAFLELKSNYELMGSLLSFNYKFFCYIKYRWHQRACGPFVIKWRHLI